MRISPSAPVSKRKREMDVPSCAACKPPPGVTPPLLTFCFLFGGHWCDCSSFFFLLSFVHPRRLFGCWSTHGVHGFSFSLGVKTLGIGVWRDRKSKERGGVNKKKLSCCIIRASMGGGGLRKKLASGVVVLRTRETRRLETTGQEKRTPRPGSVVCVVLFAFGLMGI